MIKTILSSTGGWSGILAGLIVFGNYLIPVLPTAWSNLVGAILGVIALYYHGKAVTAGRALGAKGI